MKTSVRCRCGHEPSIFMKRDVIEIRASLEAHVSSPSQITFKTSLGDDLRVSSAPLVVPARLSRQGLSEVVNHLLNLPKVRIA
jgi:hypothetical protein